MDPRQWQQLDLNLLRLFVVLNQEQNLSRAAERLHITPSAVSHALKRLRGHFADELFVRKGTTMHPTPLCKRLFPVVSGHMDGLYNALKHANAFDPSQHALHIRIAMPDAIEQIVLPELVSMLNSKALQVRVDSVALRRSDIEFSLGNGDIDFAFDVARPLGHPIRHQPVFKDQFCVLGWQQFSKEILTANTYLEAAHIGVSSRPKGATVEEIAIRQAGFDRNEMMRCQTYHAALALVAQGQGILTLPERLAKQLIGQQPVSLDPMPFALADVVTHVYSHETLLQDPALSWVYQSVCTMFG